jgi:hypothetical protein
VEDAVPPLEEALRIRTQKGADPERLGEVRFALARAVGRRAAEKGRARTLAYAARADYAAAGDGKVLAVIDRWLGARAGSN